MPDGRNCYGVDSEWDQARLGTYSPGQKRLRPMRMTFDSMKDKHTFLKHAKYLKEVGLRYDDDVRLQQKQCQDLSQWPAGLKNSG